MSAAPRGGNGRFLSAVARLAPVVAQLAQAATSFALLLAYANLLGAARFGLLSVFVLVYVLLMSAFRAIIGEQLLAGGPRGDARAVAHVALLLAPVYVLAGAAASAAAGFGDLVWAVAYLACYAASDGIRYAFMHSSGPRGVLALASVDTLRAILGVGALALSLSSAAPQVVNLLAVAAGSAWLLIGVARYGPPSPRRAWTFLRTRGSFEIAMSTQFLLGSGTSQFVPLLGLWAFGAVEFGHMRLAQNLVAPAATLAAAFQPTVIRYYAHHAGDRERQRLLRLLLLCAGTAAVVIALALAAAPWFLSTVTPSYGAEVLAYLVPASVSIAFVAAGLPGGALIRVRRLGRVSFAGQMIGTVVGVIAAVIAATLLTPLAFAWALSFGSLSTVLASYALLLRRLSPGT